MHFRYVLWDFDGTLFDTYPPLADSIERALADSGKTEPRDFIIDLLNQTLDLTITTLTKKNTLDREEFENRLYEYWAKVPIDAYPPFPGAIDLCQRFVNAGGQHFIFTHRGQNTLMQMLDHHSMTNLFSGIMTRDNGYPRKPDPTGFNALIDTYGLSRADLLTVGDRDLDILAGQAAGIKTCLFNALPSPGVQPDYMIASLDELRPVLGLA